MKFRPAKMLPVVAAVTLACGSMLAAADPTVTLALGETITVNGASPADAGPSACTGSGTVSCANLRSAIAHANGNGNQAGYYDLIVLANGSTHTLSQSDAGATEAIDASDNSVGDLDLTTPMVIATADNTLARATIEGGTGFNDRLLHITALTSLNNLVLTKGQGVHMNGGAIYAGDLGNTTIVNSLIHGNFASWDELDGSGEAQGSGGGIYSKGPLSISKSTLSNNKAWTIRASDAVKVGNGGAIYASQATTLADSTLGGSSEPNPTVAFDPASTTLGNLGINGAGLQMAGGNKLEIVRSTLSYNYGVSGGAINVVSPAAAPFTITNSTLSNNHVTDSGAGLNTNSSVTITNATIAYNRKDSGNKGSGVNIIGGTVTLKNTLLAENVGDALGTFSDANCGRTGTGTLNVLTQGGNLSTDGTCNLTYSNDQQNVADAKIGALALNGNSYNGTWTHAPAADSPALDKADNNGCPAIDQRGFIRPLDALVVGSKVCDVGAYELFVDRNDIGITSMTAAPATVALNATASIAVQVSNADDAASTNVVLTVTLPTGVEYQSGSAGCSAAGSTVTCALGTLASMSSSDVTLGVKVTTYGSHVVSATVASDTTGDLVPANNTASATVAVPTPSSGGGSGCSSSRGDAPLDPTLPLLAAAGLIGLGLRRTRRS